METIIWVNVALFMLALISCREDDWQTTAVVRAE